ncbi:DJ-1/PfpI/YhbO family deglycase/protease [Rhizobium sp. L1K21]|uniref:DJ-1/PfpI/YhbO family deglycase/protease n=1 Tax=Rhizobium sp. L1K21 TaxID=2954933 RepID=UPI002092C9F3|nr:type 1 glutamine amidotransferase domain-containing protein [Rhizobium sp. L1K21]MCO6188583.1 type 1 glutamine amidotransferase [Rhizobium sp. L1K21]
MPSIQNARILIMATNGFEESELLVPRDKLKETGAQVSIASPDGADIKSWRDKNWGETVKAHVSVKDVNTADYDALVLPGGQINPDILRTNGDALEIIRKFWRDGKVIAAICHAPWLLIEADLVKGRQATSYHSIKTDMINAGADWRDVEVVADEGVVTSRSPADLDAFVAKIIEEIQEGRHDRKAA